MTTWDAMADVWRAADDIELFESAWLFDHFEPILGKPRSGPCLEGWTVLAAMAAATRRIRIGVMVTGMPYRHPAVLANMAATVDVISGGRLELGLGAGWNQQECDAYGIDLLPLRDRFDLFDEGVEAIVRLLSQETTTLEGKHVRLTEARCEPKPVQRPHPPIAIGGNGPTRTLRTTARWAQHWNSISRDPQRWLGNQAVLHERCAEIGRDPAEITCSVNVRTSGADSLGAVAEQAAAYAEAGVDMVVVYVTPPHDARLVEPLAKELEQVTG
jgi:F420-dependent oxidoreductase-like protein